MSLTLWYQLIKPSLCEHLQSCCHYPWWLCLRCQLRTRGQRWNWPCLMPCVWSRSDREPRATNLAGSQTILQSKKSHFYLWHPRGSNHMILARVGNILGTCVYTLESVERWKRTHWGFTLMNKVSNVGIQSTGELSGLLASCVTGYYGANWPYITLQGLVFTLMWEW